MFEEDPIPMETSLSTPKAQDTNSMNEVINSTESSPLSVDSGNNRSESAEQIEAANTLMLLQDASSNTQSTPSPKKQRKSGSPKKRASATEKVTLGAATKDTLEVDVSALTSSGLVRVVKDTLASSKTKNIYPLKSYYESLLQKQAEESGSYDSCLDTFDFKSENESFPVTQFFQLAEGEEGMVPSTHTPKPFKGGKKNEGQNQSTLRSILEDKPPVSTPEMQLQLHLVDLEEVRRKASNILKRENSNREETAPTDAVARENALRAEIKDHQKAINVEILKLVNRQEADILKLVNRHKALRSLAKATKTKLKAADNTVMNTLVVQTIREHAYAQPEEKQLESTKGDSSQASTEGEHSQPPQALVSKITPQVANKIRKLVRSRLTESVAHTKASKKTSSGDSEQINRETVSALKIHGIPKRSGGGVTKRTKKRANQGDKTTSVASDSPGPSLDLNVKSHQSVLKRKKLISNLLGRKNRTFNKSLGALYPKHSIAGSQSKAKQKQTSRRPKASHCKDSQSHIPISVLQTALKKISQSTQVATASPIHMLHVQTALKNICRKARISLPIPNTTSVSSTATAPVQVATTTATTSFSQTPNISSSEAPASESSTALQKPVTSEQKPEPKQMTLEPKSSTKATSNVTTKPATSELQALVSEPNSSASEKTTAIPTKPEAQPTQAEVVPPSTDLKSLLSSLKTVPKGLNLPVLEFLKVNFPALRLDTLGDIMQVNSMLTKTLQMQQQVLQSQETLARKTLLPGAFDGINTQPGATTGALTTPTQTIGPIPGSVDQSISLPGQSGPSGSNVGKTPVMVQIIKTAESSSSSPKSRSMAQKRMPSGLTVTPLPLHTTTKLADELYYHAKSEAVQQAKSVLEQADFDGMEIDVVGTSPPEPIQLPAHLRDHTYSLYNPVNGERTAKPKLGSYKPANIPPARVSYAPPLPESPTLLYKLLKVAPRKPGSKTSTKGKPPEKAPFVRAKQGRFTPSGGGRARRGRGLKEMSKSGRGSKSGSRAQSEEVGSQSSGSDHSDTEGSSEMVTRRRSQRFTGQRKRYIDDVNVSLSDDENQELIVSLPTTRKSSHNLRDEDDGEYSNEAEGVSRTKVKSKAKPINPTEGFQYSDIYFEPPAEDAEVVERILTHRIRETITDEEKGKYGEKMEEYFVKYKSYSYLHAKWATFDKLLSGDKRFEGKVKRYRTKLAMLGVFAEDEDTFNPEYTVVDRVLDKATQEEVNGEVVTHFLVKWCSLPYEDSTWELMEDVDNEAIRLYGIRTTPPIPSHCTFVSRPPPSGFKPVKTIEYREGNKLRSYQLEGVNWLLFNWYTRQNCILADEMGLGKTVQSIALLQEIYNTGIKGPFLVIAPLSTIANWQREAELWTDFNIIVYHGSAYSRRLIHEYELYHRDDSGKIIPNTYKFDIIITTYEVILSDDSELAYIQWRVVIIDEAHRLKNRNCKLLDQLKAIDMEHRILLTGTPLQNSVEELFSLLNFLEPSTFTSHLTFLQQFGELKTEEQVDELKAILKPMMLRRLKEDVEKSLAPKEETIVEVELTVSQKQYYRAILEKNFTFLSKPGGGGVMPSLLNVMMELRKCCNHPFLIQGAEQTIVADYQRRNPNSPETECLVQASGKLVLISKLLPKLKANGHKVLVFSQMVRCLDMLEDFLRMRGYLYERIDGNVRGPLRQAAIDRFSKPNSDRFVFLLCTRAGGLGINLTAADTVIIYDSDWNPQNDLQAQARCHRIGQNKPVKVYRLITRNTYERDMFDRASLKLGLDKAVLQSSGSAATGSGPPQMTKKEVEDLLKKGAYGALLDEDDDANKFCEEDIDQILERRTQVIQLESEGKGSTFAKASFSADGSTDISIDDPNFWQKWAEKANLDLDELANKDTLVIDTPRQRRQVRRYGNDNQEEVVDMGDIIDEVVDLLPSRGKQGWTKLECLKVEKGLLTFGWANWKRIIRNTSFSKRQLGSKDMENIARTILVYCLSHFTGDDKVTAYVNRLIDPGITTETEAEEDKFYQAFSEEDLLELKAKDSETLFEDDSYMKHLVRHANKILLRVRQLHVLRWSMLVDQYDQIMAGDTIKELKMNLPLPEESPPAPWWVAECDYSLLVGIVKHGYEMFGPMRADRALCFRALCGEEPRASSKKKKAAIVRAAALAAKSRAAHGVESEGSGNESDWDEGLEEPSPGKKTTKVTKHGGKHGVSGLHPWPTLADVNTRARRYITTWLRHQRREEVKQHNIQREHFKKEKEAEHQRKKEQRKAELAQKWSKREEQDFARVVAYYGVVFNSEINKYDWSQFRILASLNKKSDERLTLYFHDFKRMCWRVLKKRESKSKRGLSGIAVETINEERASRSLQRISLMSAIREEIQPHPKFDELIKLCELSFEVPSWWLPVIHDTDLIKGVTEHGLIHSEDLIYNDPHLRFKSTVPQSALYDPNIGIEREESTSSEEDEEEEEEEEDRRHRRREGLSSNPSVPLGWPKDKAIVIRLSRIVYAFRTGSWPRPMEGLDLFIPAVDDQSSSSESEVDVTSDEDWDKGSKKGAEPIEETEGVDRDFEIEKSQGLKITLKKAPRTRSTTSKMATPPPDNAKLMVRIPLVQLKFASSSGLKRIPKKRSLEQDDLHNNTPDAKRQRTSTAHSKNVLIVDPLTVNVEDLGGQEKVGVVNRNTREKLPLRQSPTLKNLSLWLDGHPHFNVEPSWGPVVIEWGALKADMHHRVLIGDSDDTLGAHEHMEES